MSPEFLMDCLMLIPTARDGAWCVGATESECSWGGERCTSVNFLYNWWRRPSCRTRISFGTNLYICWNC